VLGLSSFNHTTGCTDIGYSPVGYFILSHPVEWTLLNDSPWQVATQNRMGAKLQTLSDTGGGGNSRRQFLSDPDTCTGVFAEGSDQMENDIRYAFAAKVPYSAIDTVESRLATFRVVD